jgi:acyl-CoA synthetase (AMP-forming)/AMP-acid ligase II
VKENVGLLLTKRAQLSPDVEGFVDFDTNRRFTFPEWNARANRVAKGDRVALLQMNSVEYMESFFAIAKIGAICVPLNWRLVPDELSFILRDAGVCALIYGSEFGAAVGELRDRGNGVEGTLVRAWMSSEDEPWTGAEGRDELYIMYTSGTTGLPKGVVHTHESALWGLLTIAATADLRAGDRYLVALPLFHVGALTPATGCAYGGVTTIVMRAFDPVKAWRIIQDERVTTGLMVPAMLNFMLQAYEPGKFDHSLVRWCMSGAAPVPVPLIEAYQKIGIEIHQVYGLTETCGPACLITGEDALARIGSTGRAFFHTDVRIVDESGEDCATGEAGEVWVRGRHVMKEYWNRPDATAESIVDGWLRTGDGASMDAEGFVYIQDRIKDMIISGGENVYPAEIENVLVGHEGILDAAVIGQPSERWGESPVAIVIKGVPALSEHDVLTWCQGKLARFKQPKAVHFVEEIPRNPSGKILKRVLREQFPGPAAE